MNNIAKVFVSNLAFTAKWQAVKTHFAQSGNVMFVKIFTDPETKKSKGMGIVTFEKPEEAQNAIQNLNGSDLEGRKISVREFQEREPKQTTTEEL